MKTVLMIPDQLLNDPQFVNEYLNESLLFLQKRFAKFSRVMLILSAVFNFIGIATVLASIFIYQNDPIDAVIVCWIFLYSYSKLADERLQVAIKNSISHRATAFDKIITFKAVVYVLILIFACVVHWYVLQTVTITNIYDMLFYWLYPVLLLIPVSIGFGFYNKGVTYLEISMMLASTDFCIENEKGEEVIINQSV